MNEPLLNLLREKIRADYAPLVYTALEQRFGLNDETTLGIHLPTKDFQYLGLRPFNDPEQGERVEFRTITLAFPETVFILRCGYFKLGNTFFVDPESIHRYSRTEWLAVEYQGDDWIWLDKSGKVMAKSSPPPAS